MDATSPPCACGRLTWPASDHYLKTLCGPCRFVGRFTVWTAALCSHALCGPLLHLQGPVASASDVAGAGARLTGAPACYA
jgi:hypothetical protein